MVTGFPFAPITVVETSVFLRSALTVMDDLEREELVDFLAYNPDAGDLVPGTGGLRKVKVGN